MTVNYTTLLALGQPVTGTESGTWGDDVNNAVTSYLDIAIAGTLSLTSANFTAGALTIANTQGTNTTTNIGSTTAQYAVLKVSSLATNSTITAPSTSKTYLVINADSTYTLTVKASGQTGYTVAPNTRAWVVFNGTDYVLASTNDVSKLSGLGTGVATALAVNVGTAGAFVVNGGALGTPSSGTLSSCTSLPISTGVSGLGTGVATALAVNTGTAGAFVVNGGALGTPSSGTLSSCTSLPISTGVSGLGTGVATALAVNTGTAGAFVVNGGALGTPSSGTVTNLTGTASININGTVGATTPSTGAFTTLSASSTVSGTGFSTYLASPPAIGGTAPAAGSFTSLTSTSASGIVTVQAATQDGVKLLGRAAGTSSYVATITPAALTASRTVTIPDETFTIGFRNIPAVGTKTGSYTLAVGDVGKYVQLGSGGSITIPNSTFAEGDVISLFNNTTGNITITCSTTTAYIAGTDSSKASMTLATRGVATVLFISSTVCVVSGNVS